jgi:hypothetical protein
MGRISGMRPQFWRRLLPNCTNVSAGLYLSRRLLGRHVRHCHSVFEEHVLLLLRDRPRVGALLV